MKIMADTTSGLFSDGIHWYRPITRNGATVLEKVDDSKVTDGSGKEIKGYGEVSDRVQWRGYKDMDR